MLRAALIGFGGISKSHRKGYINLKEKGIVELVCACDINPSAFNNQITINIDSEKTVLDERLNYYTDLDTMIEKEDFDFVDICVPTYLHAEMTQYLLKKGYHVLCEKPMALNYSDCEKMIETAKECNRELMIGQCLRFEPSYVFLKSAVVNETFGKVEAAYFSRLSGPPTWGYKNWFMKPELSGGCLTDMHIHDVDMVRHLFGEPKAVACKASTSVCVHDAVHTSFTVDCKIPITAVGDWTLSGTKFNASYRVNFEKATLICEGGALTVYPKSKEDPYRVKLSGPSGYQGEVEYFCNVIEGKTENTVNPASSAAKTIKLLEYMRESADDGGKVIETKL